MSKKHLVSIIVPVYNAEKHLRRCIDSIISQSYETIEIILLNDGSSDNSLSILKEYEKKDKRVVVIDKENEGVAKTRNLGIRQAKGEYISFVDNDDFLEETYIEKLINALEDNDLVIARYRRINNDKKILLDKRLSNRSWSKYENVTPWGKIIKKSILLDNGIEFFSFPIGEDLVFNLKLYTSTDKIKVTNDTYYNWFYNDESISNTKQKSFIKDIITLFEEMKKYDKNEEISYFIVRYHVWYLLFAGRNETKSNFIKEYNKLTHWLKLNGYASSLKISKIFANESTLGNKVSILVFTLIEKLRLVNLFAQLFCKGSR